MRWDCAVALVGVCALTWGAGCELSRPDGAYDGGVPWLDQQRVMTDSIANETVDTGEDFFSDPGMAMGGADGGSANGGTTGGGDSSAGGGGADNSLLPHTGDYYFKIVTVSQTDGGSNLGTVTSTSTSYGQMRVVIGPDGKLVAEEKLCYLDTKQTASTGASVGTSIADRVAQNFLPIKRTFELTDGGWSTDVVRRRQGWRSDLDPDVMPTDPTQTNKFTDPDGDSVVGYRTTVEGAASVGGLVSAGRKCAYDVVSYSDTGYVGGKFGSDGVSFASADIVVEDSDLAALYAERLSGTGTCSTSDVKTSSQIESDRITLVRVETLADHRACAPESAYDSVL